MKRIIPLSLLIISMLNGSEVTLETIGVESTFVTEVSKNAQTSADLADALSSSIPSIDMNRRSGIANDIYIRGQKRDNISVEVDGTKVCGACVNRMDPPVSHILASQIDNVEVIEGPYDVENFGTLSGGVKITTKQPSQREKGELNFGIGSWGYKKLGATFSGGNEYIRLLLSGSMESSGQYKDGNGDTIAQQLENYASKNPAVAGTQLKPEYEDMDAYSKKSLMTKVYIPTFENQELRVSYTANRSDDVLYGNSKMDAVYDNSNIYSVEYNIDNITDFYKNINLQYYYSDVNHPMSTEYRLSSNNPAMANTNHLKTTMSGIKLKNSFDLDGHKILIGLDSSRRTWDGDYYKTETGLPLPTGNSKSIDNSLTKNMAIFTTLKKEYGALNVDLGLRYDSTEITHETLSSNSYNALGLNFMLSYNLNDDSRIFLGAGEASRVPDARELYFRSSNGAWVGTEDLKQTTNNEVDLGYELSLDMFDFKIKTFYSKLDDYIYYQKGLPEHNFKNIDATIYGAELTASIYPTDEITIDMGLSYKKGKKDEALEGQSDKDLADIAPLRGDIKVSYEYAKDSTASVELKASDKWNNIDSDNGEQELNSWAVVNLKLKHAVNKKFNFTLGVNNLFDKTYIINNSYADLTLITVADGSDDVMLMNEPGRYLYTNVSFKF